MITNEIHYRLLDRSTAPMEFIKEIKARLPLNVAKVPE